MKIACESCGAKYSIADEKVAGKVFKIRCKRCSEVIVVRGDQQEAAGSGASLAGAGAIWHVVIDGEQAGPYSPAQLAELLSSGSVDWEAYVWTEGFDNWLPMRDVPDLVAQITGGSDTAAQATTHYDAGADAFAAQPSMGADPFADSPSHGGPDLFGGGAASAEPASPFDGGHGGQHVVASSPSPRASAAHAAPAPEQPTMTGARNENSVLFSLKNLQALATGSGGAPSMPAVSAAPGQDRAGFAGGEGSGLIDIRALASATGVGEAESRGPKDELLSLGSQSAFGALGSPMLAPSASDEGGGKKMLIWASVAGVGLLSVAAVAVAYIMRPSPAPAASAVGTAPAVAAAVAPAAAPKPEADEEADDAPSEGELAAKRAKESDEKSDDDSSERGSSSKRSSKRSGSDDSSSKSEPAAKSDPAPEAKPAPSKPGGPRTIDDLLDGALGGGSKPAAKAASAEPKSDLPDQPTKGDVVSAMKGVQGEVSSCAKGQSGVAFVNVSIAGSTGRVTSAEVTGITGPAGSCIAKAVRGAQFPKFQQKVFKVKYPFKL